MHISCSLVTITNAFQKTLGGSNRKSSVPVRILKYKNNFAKVYTQFWPEEVSVIKNQKNCSVDICH